MTGRLRHALRYPRLYAAAWKVRRQLRRLGDVPLPEALALARALRWPGGQLRPTQSTEEILWLLGKVAELEPRVVVEIGTDEGGTLFLWTRVAAPDATLVAVDVRPLGLLGIHSAYGVVRRGLARARQRVKLVMPVDSHDPATVERVRRLLGDRPVDFLFIDGDHSYDGVRRDFELWSPLVRRGGFVAFHDVKPDSVHEVPRFWAELTEGYRTEQKIAGEGPSYGLGIVHVT